MQKLKLDLELALPGDAAECAACVGRILALLRGRTGIDEAHVDTADAPPRLCIHYDPNALRLERVESLVRLAGAEVRGRFDHLAVDVDGLRHERQARLVEGALQREAGVFHAAIAFGARRVYVEFASDKTSRGKLIEVLVRAGLRIADRGVDRGVALVPSSDASKHVHRESEKHDHEHDAKDEHAHDVPATALRIKPSGGEEEVPVSQLAVADKILVKPNTRIAADGFVLSGSSSVNQAPITGESVPVDKSPAPDVDKAQAEPNGLPAEHRGFAGTINGPAALTISVTKLAAESTLARVVKLVSEAETQASPTQQFTNRFERIFVPVIIAFVILLLFAWLVIDETFAQSFYRAMAVLVAASPCALAIATPSAVLSGVARAARGGVLIKGGANLEILGIVRAVAFDKTGTLTVGKPKLTDVVTTQGASEEELLRTTLAVEKQSDHPLAIAIVEGAAAKLPSAATSDVATNVEAIMGFGIRALVGTAPVVIGKPGLFTRAAPLPAEVAQAAERLQVAGRSVMIVKSGERFLGAIGVMDTPRAEARDVIAQLHAIGIEQTIMLTGDNQRVADAVAKDVGLTEARGDLLPENKVTAIAELANSKSLVAMVGDGVNDAPAMANATIGICMGAGSSDVALEIADVALMGDDLRALPFAIGLSRAARRIIRQNLWASLGMVAFLIPATIFGFAGIGVAVALHEGSTLLVVVNALRLLAYKEKAARA